MTGQTKTVSSKDIKIEWHLIDGTDKVLGRLASDVAQILTGKSKAFYSPNINCGDKVVIINSSKIRVTGGKLKKKIYYRHSGYPGGFKSRSMEVLLEKKPTEVFRKAVWGMLPVNKLRKIRINNLYIYTGDKQPHSANINYGKK